MSNLYTSKEQSTETKHRVRQSKKVRFAEDSEVIFFDQDDDDDLRLRWCTREDDLKFRRVLVRDIGILTRIMRLAHTSNANLASCMWKFVGLESYASPAIARLMAESKRQHIESVLNAQYQMRQRTLVGTNNAIDPETASTLAVISQQSSSWARSRSHQMASKYSVM